MSERQYKFALANCRRTAQAPLFGSPEIQRLLRQAARASRLADRVTASLEKLLKPEKLERIRVGVGEDGCVELLTADRATLDALRSGLSRIRAGLLRKTPGVRRVSVVYETEEPGAYDHAD